MLEFSMVGCSVINSLHMFWSWFASWLWRALFCV